MKLRLLLIISFLANTILAQNFHDTKGNIDVNGAGQLQFNLPIALPPSVKTVAPQLNLVYSSSGGNSIAGIGFSLNGITSISRVGKNIEKDGESKGVQLNYSDFYEFNGQRLLLKSGVYGQYGAEYVTEKFSTLKITSLGLNSYGPESFEVTYDNGAQAWYGVTNESKTFLEYNLTKWKDAQGNYITYNYTKNNNTSLISSIFWGGNETLGKPHFNSIVFNYNTRTVQEVSYVRGVRFLQDKILNNIVVNANGNLFKKYVLEYVNDNNNTNYQYVSKVTEYNSLNQPANPVTFTYETSNTSGVSSYPMVDSDNNKIVGDFNGDGVVDYIKYFEARNVNPECLEWEPCIETDADGNQYPGNCCVQYGPFTISQNLKFFSSFVGNSTVNDISGINMPFTKAEFNNAKAVSFKNSNNEISARQGFLITKKLPNYVTIFEIYSISSSFDLVLESTKTVEASQYIGSFPQYTTGVTFNGIGYTLTNVVNEINEVQVYDLDGDGLSELIMPISENVYRAIFYGENLFYPEIFNKEQHLIINLDQNLVGIDAVSVSNLGTYGSIIKNPKVGDFKGEGKIQFYFPSSNNLSQSATVSFVKNKVTNKFSTIAEMSWNGLFGDTDYCVFGDFNGDRKTDILVPRVIGGSDWYLYISTGKGFKLEIKNDFLRFKPFEDYNYVSNVEVDYYLARKQTYRVLDLDKDGKSELIAFNFFTKEHTESGYEHRDSSTTAITVIKNVGANATTDVNFAVSYYNTFDFPLFDFNELIGDYNINQINNNIVLIGNYRRNRSQGFTLAFNLYDCSKSSRIKTITQGGIATSVDYKEINNQINYDFYNIHSTPKYPFVELSQVSNSYLVSQLSQQNRKQYFKYRGLLAHLNGRGTIGFRQTARTNWYADGFENTRIWSGQEIDPLQNGVIIKQWSTLNSSDVFPTSLFVNTPYLLSYKALSYISDKPDPLGPEAILPKSSIEKDFLKNITKTETITYGNYYLPTQVVTNINNGFGTSISNTVYSNNETGVGSDYYIGRITEKETIVSAYGDTKKSKTKYTYQNNLPETVKTFNQDESANTLETFINDGFGNTKEKTVTNSQDTQSINSKIEYDSKGIFPIKNTDNLGLITLMSYNDLGQLLNQTDPFGNTIVNQYDGWGKLTTTSNNLSGTTSYNYNKVGDDIVTTVLGSAGESTETRTNKKGEQYLVTTKGYKTGSYIAKQVVYDAVGRKIKESEPYYTTEPIKWNILNYDDTSFPPIVKVTSFTGKVAETQIIDKTTIIKELTGYEIVTKKTTDALGNIIQSEDRGGTIYYNYNALGQNLIAKYEKNYVQTTYDTWGRKKTFHDPSNGLYQFDYDGFGKLKMETSPKGKKEYIFNTLGQLITQKELSTDDGGVNTNKTINYGYDAKGLVINKTGTSNGLSYNSLVNYDANSRITSTEENSNNRTYYKKNIIYDSVGRIISYEKGLNSAGGITKATIENGYTTWGGDLFQVKDSNTQKILWKLEEAKANGQVLNAKLGNVSITNIYDNANLINSISHSSTLEANVLKMSYTFNPLKNELTTRSRKGSFNVNEVFNYDDNNRLINWTNPKTGLPSENKYDNKGRILNNDQVGIINYTSDKIYQSTSATLNDQGNINYLVYKNKFQKITYNENNDPIFIDTDKGSVSFSYGLSEMRQKVSYGSNFKLGSQGKFTKYYSEDASCEVIVDNTTGKEKYILYIGGSPYDSNIIFVKDFLATTANYLFLHKDYLGSILAISNENGKLVEERHFDAWGVLTHGKMNILDRGYTSHEHFAQVGIIHMNGRLYDPILRRFLNADENIQDPYNTQNYNKYAYVMNNPLLFNDPSGEELITLSVIATAALIGAIVGVTTYAIGLAFENKLDQFNGGQALKSAFFGAISGALTCGLGDIFSAAKVVATLGKATFLVQAAAHGVAQGALSAVQGGDFWQGAAGGFFGSLGATAWQAGAGAFAKSAGGTIAFGALSGGVGAELTGGNFWQGAVTGGIVAGLNHAMHSGGDYDQEDPPAKGSGKRYFMGDKFENAQFQKDIQAGNINPEIAYKSFMEYADMGLTFAGGMFPASSIRLGTTLHGTQRIAGSLATRGGVLSLKQAWTTRILGSGFKQADGATVYLRQLSNGRYNAVVWGEKGIITTMKGWSQKSIDRIAKNYGWKF